ncbi:MAG TPA: methyl-accepting chemotaxis protein [Pseudomonas sp.]|nr:methyl-accepting chemotaxis protein [Pseudomonas sp.]
MRLKLLTPAITLIMLMACLVLGATLWWSQQALDRPRQMMDRYLALSQQLQRLDGEIGAYLDTGDALRHRAAQEQITLFTRELEGLPAALTADLHPSLDQLRRFVDGDLLAAGKLAADPQGLLLQAEREMSAALRALGDYAREAEVAAARDYPPRLLDAALQLQRLGLLRGQLAASDRGSLLTEVRQALDELAQAIEAIRRLPLLGVLEDGASASGAFAALLGLESETPEVDRADRGIALKRELHGLAQRYPAELDSTHALIRQRQQLREASQARSDDLRLALAALEPLVRGEQQRIQAEVGTLQGLAIILILLAALLTYGLQRHLTRMLGQMDAVLQHWASGDFTLPVRLISRLDEVGRIGQSLNRLRQYLAELVDSLRRHAGQVGDSSRQLTELSQALHASTERQARGEAQVYDALGELEQSIQRVAGDAEQAAEASRHAGEATRQSHRVIESSLADLQDLAQAVRGNGESIARLTEESAGIEQVLDVIGALAEQTNLLALNAAIEAARAGDSGRGFAVVADEVRALARRSAEATEQIRLRIAQLQQTADLVRQAMHRQVTQAERGAAQAESADAALQTVVDGIRAGADMARRIAAATAEQSAGIGLIHRHSSELRQLGQENLTRIGEAHIQSEALLGLSQQLQNAADAFRTQTAPAER